MDEWTSRRALTPADGVLLAALTMLLFCVYLLTASLTFISDDELFLFDTTESFARHGSVYLSETADLRWPGETDVEPAMPLLAAPIYWLANQFDGIGNVHATLLFNPLVTALTGTLVFLYLRQLAFERLTALAGGLLFGLATIAWPYSKTFFREPLHTATIFATAYSFLRWRDAFAESRRTAGVWLALTLGLALLSFFAKESALFVLPLLLLLLAPRLSALRRSRKEWLGIGVGLVAAAALVFIGLWIFDSYFNSGRFEITPRLEAMGRHASFAWKGVAGYLVSPGKSLFLFSPPLVLALAAPFIGERRRRFDAGWALILLAVFVVIYAFVRGELWWGGTNWGPRYMVPLTPFLIVAAAPAFDSALRARSWLPKLGLAALFLFGIAVQIGGVSILLHDYYNWIGAIRPDGAWTIGLWAPYYSAVFSHWRLLGAKPPDFAWMLASSAGPAWIVPALMLGLVGVGVGAMRYGLAREVQRRGMWIVILIGLLATAAATWFSLRAIDSDQRYQGNQEALQQLNAALAEATPAAPDPVIILNNRTYFNFMLNYYKGPLEWYTLPINPNEITPPGAPRPAPNIDPATLLNKEATGGKGIIDIVDCFGRQHPPGQPLCSGRDHQTLFLIMEFGPFTPGSPRPLEWWLSRNFYYRGVREFGPTVRLVQFSTAAAAPDPAQPAAHPADYRLGDSIKLIGWDAAPEGAPLRPGAVLNISTQWQAVAAPGADFKIGLYLISAEGSVAAQDDSFPVNGFWPTVAWQPGETVRHNIALALPPDLPPGFYEVWTLMYSAADGSRLEVQDPTNTTIRDHIALFTVEVTR